MAQMKSYQQAREQAEKEKTYKAKVKNLRLFPLLGLVMALVVLLLFFVSWSYIYNSDPTIGVEEKISGFNCFTAGISGNYSGTASVLGSMDIFNYYAGAYTVKIGTVTVVAFFLLLAEIAAFIVGAIKNKGLFSYVALALGAAVVALLFVCYSIGLSMKDAEILSGFCQGNPKCSIRSEAILPALLSLFSLVIPVVEIIRRALLKKAYKG